MNKKGVNQDIIDALLGPSLSPNLQLPDPNLVQWYDDLENRIYWVADEIGSDTLDLFSKIIFWNRQDVGIPIEERKPIRIILNSPGGVLDVEETLVSIIKMSKTPVYGIAIGCVASAASLIYLACHKKLALPNAYWIFHRGSCSNIGGNYNEVQAAMKDYKEQIEKMEKFYIEHTRFSEETIKEKIQNDWYIHIDEALANGVVDGVVESIDIFL